MSSVSGYIKNYPSPLYVASKHAILGFTRSMGDAEQHQGVKVACICPGNVNTPLWTEGTPGAGARYGLTEKNALTAETVAEAINEVVESPDIPGGAVIEVSLAGTRVLPEWNISPPPAIDDKTDGRGVTASPEIIQNLLCPIVKVTDAERGKLRDRQ
ncbi:hypothetical protein KVR01_012650 [Diaporthe batatas]|uniref:uncharacterized protein n=1 Tax=Diaporthe batatas TaxID=748121 RepID=UPI001D04F719|nr:uncharacterized protein KVR01_012650 [Diaporthe batatas]KAG8157608.1 hypothetical protein KVR01_012650 [Diaporthe batatas]